MHNGTFGSTFRAGRVLALASFFPCVALLFAAPLTAPTSKLFVAEIDGTVRLETGDKIVEMTKKTLYSTDGAIIESARVIDETNSTQHAALVYSNGTGIYFAPGTRLEVKKFTQEPFAANRTDVDVEPSISQTHAFLSRGMIALCTSRQVAGSSMVYETPQGAVNVRGRRVTVEVGDEQTVVSALEGEHTIRASVGQGLGAAAQTLHAGERAILREGVSGQPGTIQIEKIPDDKTAGLEDKAALACLARRTVFFDTDQGSAIVATDLLSAQLPTQFTVSPARLP